MAPDPGGCANECPFRDRDAWTLLELIVPELFAGKTSSDQVRVWVAGRATGEEAYSVAMLLHEHVALLDEPPAIQVFATDIDEAAITIARGGIYPETIVVDVPSERLKRFFTGRYSQTHATQGGYTRSHA